MATLAHTAKPVESSLAKPCPVAYHTAMEMSQIRYFLAVARELHFTRAAAACNVSQPALTKAIQKLEEEFGGLLFFREKNATTLSELGQLMRPSLERALMAATEAKLQADAFKRRETSPLRIGIELSLAAPLLRPALSAIARHCADVDLLLVQESQADICTRMLAGTLDVAILVEDEILSEKLHRWPLFDERYVVAFDCGHAFHASDTVNVRQLEAECILMLQRVECPARRAVLAFLKQNNITPRREHLVSNQEQIAELLLASFGVHLAGEHMPLPDAVSTRALEPDPGRRRILLATPAGRPLGPTLGVFLKLMRSQGWQKQQKTPQMAA